MFDYVRCDAPLPDGWVPPAHDLMQTKSFDNVMTTVWIKVDGTIWVEDSDYEAVPKAERLYPDQEGLLGMCGALRKIGSTWRSLDFHGWCEFYGSEDPANHRGGSKFSGGKRFDFNNNELPPLIWHEYRAKFTDGKLVEVVLVERNVTGL